MSRGVSDRPVFKPYEQKQIELIPPTAEDLIPAKHLVRVVDATIDEMDLKPLLEQYTSGGGASRYHPLMLLKVFVYGYLNNIFSSRKLAKALRENIHFMWLSGRQVPDFRTLNLFRGTKLLPVMHEVFIAAVKLLAGEGYVKLEHYFVDGTKIESAANRYTFVWRKAVENQEKKLDEKLREFLQEAERLAEEENLEYGEEDLEELGKGPISAERIKEMSGVLSEVLKQLEAKEGTKKESKKKVRKMVKEVKGDCFERKEKYEQYRLKFKGRNSFSKTDPDATFMRMKEDHLRNGQLKAGYNVQVGTENGFVVNYTIHPNPTDTLTLPEHLESVRQSYGCYPRNLIADAGYGSEENYTYLDKHTIEPYVKYGSYDKEGTRKFKKHRYRADRWEYDEKKDELICAEGKALVYQDTKEYTTDAGYVTTRRMYRCFECPDCPVRAECTTSEYRWTAFSPLLWRQHNKARANLNSELGKFLRRRRPPEVETVFGQTKGNQGFRRFLMKGKSKVVTEWGLLMLAYNLKQLYRVRA